MRRRERSRKKAPDEGEPRKSAIFEAMPDGIVVLDREGRIVELNPAAERICGCAEPEAIGRELVRLIGSPHLSEGYRNELQVFLSSEGRDPAGGRLEWTLSRGDGTESPIELTLARIPLAGSPLFAAILRDITERKTQLTALEYHATHDPLTSLPNRVLILDHLQRAIASAVLEKTSGALLLMDLDRFKDVNDTLGHDRGDLVLLEVRERLRRLLRQSDQIARLGGDEFAVLLPIASGEDAVRIARKILEALEPPLIVEGLPIAVAGSIGIVRFPEHGSDANSLLKRADVAMYTVKQGGGGSYAFYTTAGDPHSPVRLALMGELRRAIEEDQLILHYQPKVEVQSGRISAFEGLVRWNHPKHGLLPPDRFIGSAERAGLIRPLTLWVLNEALRQCQSWLKEGFQVGMGVNLSVRNLQDPKLPEMVARLLERWGVPPGLFDLEITESVLMSEPARAMEILWQLRKLGVRLSIDDFGTGYSSLSYLRRLPVDEIKIDKSFVTEMVEKKDNAVIVRSTVHLAHDLDLKVVAEGVENEAIWNQLVGLSCDLAQGYYISRPLPAPEMAFWLRESRWGMKKRLL
jgi:diguanylate cyclase (GGDEF)-like protein/PAS domain S-box-containing protein